MKSFLVITLCTLALSVVSCRSGNRAQGDASPKMEACSNCGKCADENKHCSDCEMKDKKCKDCKDEKKSGKCKDCKS